MVSIKPACGPCGKYKPGEAYDPSQCYICWLSAHNPTYRKVFGGKPNASPVQLARDVTKCRHHIDVISHTDVNGQPCACTGKWLRECRVHGKCTWEVHRPGVVDCRSCVAYSVAERNWPDDPKCAIAIGHYNMPGIIELQAKMIRATCGDIPILVSDDHTEDAGEHGPANKKRLLAICEEYGLHYRDTAAERIGHAGGDLGSFWHGLHYAKENGCRVLCKLSQRFLIDYPRWLPDVAKKMLAANQPTCGRAAMYGPAYVFNLRTECVLMDVEKWTRPDILAQLRPRLLHVAAEAIVWNCAHALGGTMWGNPLFTNDRAKKHRLITWHDADGTERYAYMADKYGVDLGNGYHAGGSHLSPAYRIG